MMTSEKLLESVREMKCLLADAPPPSVAPLGSMLIVYSEYALKSTAERLFPASKNRSKRIHKKLVKRFGGEFRMVPAMWRIHDKIIAHPSFRSQLEAKVKETT